jgi:hypothetical protein
MLNRITRIEAAAGGWLTAGATYQYAGTGRRVGMRHGSAGGGYPAVFPKVNGGSP